MVSYEGKAITRASPDAVFAAWTNVAGWSKGTHVKSASIDGEFRVGAVIRTKAVGFPSSTLSVTRVEPPLLWVDESRAFGMHLTFEHVIESGSAATLLIERVIITGPLARLVGPLLRRRMEALFVASTAEIAAQAEGRTE